MGIEHMPFEQVPEDKKAPKPQKEKTGFSRFTNKIKTGIALGTAIAGIGLSEGSFEAQGAELPIAPNTIQNTPHSSERHRKLNDQEKNEHFQDFTRHYTKAIGGFKHIKTVKDAECVVVDLDTLVKFLEATSWMRTDNSETLNKRFLKSLTDMQDMYVEIERQYKISFSGERKEMFDSVAGTLLGQIEKSKALHELEKAEKKLPKAPVSQTLNPRSTGGPSISIGTSPHSGGRYPLLTPNRPQPKSRK